MKKRFPVLRQKPTQILPENLLKGAQPFIFTVYLMNHIFKHMCYLIRDSRTCIIYLII